MAIMNVEDVMTTNVSTCSPETNLAAATEIMWKADCGILPVVDNSGRVIGVITDRDICVALGTRDRLASEIRVSDVITDNLFACSPVSDIHDALETMRRKRVRRLIAVAPEGTVAGILSLDDVAAAAQAISSAARPELTLNDVALTLKAITQRSMQAYTAAS